jgi:hypothetical protein
LCFHYPARDTEGEQHPATTKVTNQVERREGRFPIASNRLEGTG